MIYIQLTTRCNMECAHCSYSCTSKGKDMSMKTFLKCVSFIDVLARREGRCQYVVLSGGEPTLHPKLFDFIDILLKKRYPYGPVSNIMVLTNGKCLGEALKLLALVRDGYIAAQLSIDQFHEPIEPILLRMWRDMYVKNCCAEIRPTLAVTDNGRAHANGIGQFASCRCTLPHITPSGRIYECGCMTKSMGTVFAPSVSEEYYNKIAAGGRFTCSNIGKEPGEFLRPWDRVIFSLRDYPYHSNPPKEAEKKALSLYACRRVQGLGHALDRPKSAPISRLWPIKCV